jgi:hypothetical protein
MLKHPHKIFILLALYPALSDRKYSVHSDDSYDIQHRKVVQMRLEREVEDQRVWMKSVALSNLKVGSEQIT